MTLSDEQYQRLLSRVTALELAMNDAVTAINNLASISQVKSLLIQIESNLTAIQTTVNSLNDRVETLEEESFE